MRFRLVSLTALATTQAGASLAQPAIQLASERPRIIVDGHGEIKSPPDLALIQYTLRGEGRTSDDAVREMTLAGARIEASLHSMDAVAEPQTGSVKVTPVKSDSCKEDDDNTPQLSSGPCAILGYVAQQTVTFRTAEVKDAGTMVGLVGRGGGVDARIDRFDLRDHRSAQAQAVAAALADAASKATTIASLSRIHMGQILSITTGTGESSTAIVVTRTARPAPVMASPPVPVALTPEPITTTSDVTVTYAIAQ